MKLFRLFLLGVYCSLAFPALAQINIASVDPGPYTPGSTIATIFAIDPASCIAKDNVFQLYLSDASGNFGAEIPIGSYNGFYSTFVNGIIPTTTTPGTGYRLRIKSTNPSLTSAPSNPFTIVAGAALEAKINSATINSAYPDAFGLCTGRNNQNFAFSNVSTQGSTVSSILKNEITGATSLPIIFDVQNKQFTAELAHYTIITRAVKDGTVSTKANFLINNDVKNAFRTGNNDVKCLPGAPLMFSVDVSRDGIGNNFPGNTYVLNWGDGNIDTYTLCDIVKAGQTVQHSYAESSCGKLVDLNGIREYNVFAINITIESPFCGRVGAPLSTTARVGTGPENRLEAPKISCVGTEVTVKNVSRLGENPRTTADGCEPNRVTYNWFVDGNLEYANMPLSFNLKYTFTTNGQHTVRIVSMTDGPCNDDDETVTICIQNPPQPSFTFGNVTTFCEPKPAFKVTNTSIIDNTCDQIDPAIVYNWTVTPAVTFANGTTANSPAPEFDFINAGIYTVMLEISTPSCGMVQSATQTIIVNAVPTVTLSPDAPLCNLSTYDFNPTTLGPTKTILEGTFKDEPTTYTWTVSGGNFNFTNNTNKNSKYPQIEFLEYKTYTIKVVHTNSCGTAEDTQVLSFSTAPVVDAGTYAAICFDAPTIQLDGKITGSSGSVTGFKWVGSGTFLPNVNTLNATYAPTPAERAAGSANIRLVVSTNLPQPCNEIPSATTINIFPEVTVNSPSTKSICTGTNVNYTPTSTTTGATFTWQLKSATANATGYTTSGTGPITDVITNTDPTVNATVIYTITPTGNSCTGVPFDLTITITPNPILTLSGDQTICSEQSAAITLTSNLPKTLYTWTSTATGGVSGATSNDTPIEITVLNEQLINNGTATGTVVYTITPISENGCPGNPKTVTITVEPQPSTPIAGADESICDVTTYTLKGNQPAVGTGKWTHVTSFPGVTFSDDTQPDAIVSGLQPNNTYIFRWTISAATNCNPKADEVSIIVSPISVGGATAGDRTVCSGNNSGQITLTGNIGTIIRWESTFDNGNSWLPIQETTPSISYGNLTITTQYRAIIQSGSCAEASSSITTITVVAPTTIAKADADQALCNATSTTISANAPGTDVGTWSLKSGQTGVTIVNPSSPSTTVTGLVGGQTYEFIWTITGQSPCGPTEDNLIVTNLAAISTNTIAVTPTVYCSGQAITVSGSTPTGGSGTYAYTWESSPNGNAPWTTIASQNGQDLSITVNSAISFRRITTSGTCASISNVVNIAVLPPIANNTISAAQQICEGIAPTQFTGSNPTGGDGTNYTFSWEQSSDEINWTVIAGANASNYQAGILLQTTFYRRTVTTATCTGAQNNISNTIKITVNPKPKAVINAVRTEGCAPFVIDASVVSATSFPENSTYTWYADDVIIGTDRNFPTPGVTLNLPQQSVVIKLVVTSAFGCESATATQTFRTVQSIEAKFTASPTTVCGTAPITFKNTTATLTGVTFEWFIDGQSVSTATDLPTRAFAVDPNGADKTYNVMLRVYSDCGSDDSEIVPIIVKAVPPQPSLRPSRTSGCSILEVTFDILSTAGSSNSYIVNFGDGTGDQTFNFGQPIVHRFENTGVDSKDYSVMVTATNTCGSVPSIPFNIRVFPAQIQAAFFLGGSQRSQVCVGEEVVFTNNTKGAESYLYDFGDGRGPIPYPATGLTDYVRHVFTAPGPYNVTMIAINSCPSQSAPITIPITVIETPVAKFSAEALSGCSGFEVQFRNTSTGATSYEWNFGDGSPTSSAFEPKHPYSGAAGSYTVTLTAKNGLGCPGTETKVNYITIAPKPSAEFQVLPGNVIGVPNYTFNFSDLDRTTSPGKSYHWDFGDGEESSAKNPSHTYSDVGTYRVTFTVTNEFGCETASIPQTVQIIGVPGYLYLPNSFIPGGTNVPLQTFTAIGTGIVSWRMTVFNKWGQVLWETTKLNDGKPIEGWDGTFKGVAQPQGIYFWKIDVQFINGTEWKGVSYDKSPPKRTGEIYLIR